MNDLKILARLSPLLVSALLLLAGCSGNSYQPLPDNLNSLLKGGTTVDTLFVRAMSAASAAEFDTLTGKYLKAYARDFDDPGLSRFDSRTPYSLRQDSLIFLMQDYLLNTYRYDESIDMGRLLDTRLTGRLADTPCIAPLSATWVSPSSTRATSKTPSNTSVPATK